MHSPLELTLVLLAAAVIGVVLFRMLQLPPMLAYLVVGVLIGPKATGLSPIPPRRATWPSSGWCS